MARLTPRFSANRSVRQYAQSYYLPLAAAYTLRAAHDGALGAQIAQWQQALEQNWPSLHLSEVHWQTTGGQHVFSVHVDLAKLDPEAIAVELFANDAVAKASLRTEMLRQSSTPDASNQHQYGVSVADDRPATEFTVRIVPRFKDVSIPLENNRILWQR
jgi:starch phosphorylase